MGHLLYMIFSEKNGETDWGPVHTNPFSNENGAVSIVHTTTPKMITENGAIRKRSPEWSDLKTMLFENAVF